MSLVCLVAGILMAAPVAVAGTGRHIEIDAGQLGALQHGAQVAFDLAGKGSHAGTVTRREDRGADRFTLSGTLDEGGTFLLAVNRHAVAGLIQVPDLGSFRIRLSPAGHHVLQTRDPADDFECLVGDQHGIDPAAFERNNTPVGGTCDDGSVIDVLVVYTEFARSDAGGEAGMLAEIDLAVDYNNLAYTNSGIALQWNLVYAMELGSGVDPSLSQLTNPADGVADGVHALRDAYGADQVALITDGGGGVANGLWNLDPSSQATAFCSNGLDSMPSVLAHEIGHNMGCCHAVGDGGGCPGGGGLLFLYSNGHRFNGNGGTLWRTIMAYSPGTRIQHFSNPSVMFDGQPTGIPEGQPPGADNAKTMNLSKLTVSNWRCFDGICQALDLSPTEPDCNDNGVPDACDIALGTSNDSNGDGEPDECAPCLDTTGDSVVGTADLLLLLASWGPCPGCGSDYDGDGIVGTSDLLMLLAVWGPCP